ncbi:MAG: hypothetical protein ACKO6N_10055 [Myxococcota bacterium]
MQDSLFSQEIPSEWQNDLVSGTVKNVEDGTLASLVHVPDFRAAMLQLILLVCVIVGIGTYVLTFMPGLSGAEMRAVTVPTHPSNVPASMMVAHTSDDYNRAFLNLLQLVKSKFE